MVKDMVWDPQTLSRFNRRYPAVAKLFPPAVNCFAKYSSFYQFLLLEGSDVEAIRKQTKLLREVNDA